ncbi:hypothetical protein QVL82_00515 [Cellulosimicrobium funkei]|uniref:hypothetical protein n=1 Tax=Cellulosimicrobium funkei TaxID=264251 RepID=UPI000396266F
MSTRTCTKKNALDAGQGIEGNVPVPTKEKNTPMIEQTADNRNAADESEVAEKVNVPDIVAPHIAAWNRLAEASDRVVDAEKPHPRNEGKYIPWCVECVDARDGERPAHPIEQDEIVHRSDRAHLVLDLGTPELHGGWAALPTIDVSVIRYLKNRSENSKGHRIQLEYRHGIDGGKVIPAMTITVAREFISMLQAAIDLATGRDDFDEAGA